MSSTSSYFMCSNKHNSIVSKIKSENINAPYQIENNMRDNNNCSEVLTETNKFLSNKRGSLQLWQFLLNLLCSKQNENIIEWTKKSSAEFKLLDPEEVARQWGVQKNRPTMNYDKLSRSLRYYYEKGIMQKVSGERYVYRFINHRELYLLNPELVDLTKVNIDFLNHQPQVVSNFSNKSNNKLNINKILNSKSVLNCSNNNTMNKIKKSKLKTHNDIPLYTNSASRYSPYQRIAVNENIDQQQSYYNSTISNTNNKQLQPIKLMDENKEISSLSIKNDSSPSSCSSTSSFTSTSSRLSSNYSQYQTVPLSTSPKQDTSSLLLTTTSHYLPVTPNTPNYSYANSSYTNFNANQGQYQANGSYSYDSYDSYNSYYSSSYYQTSPPTTNSSFDSSTNSNQFYSPVTAKPTNDSKKLYYNNNYYYQSNNDYSYQKSQYPTTNAKISNYYSYNPLINKPTSTPLSLSPTLSTNQNTFSINNISSNTNNFLENDLSVSVSNYYN